MHRQLTRREILISAAAGGASVSLGGTNSLHAAEMPPQFRYCFNTSTIRGQNLPLDQVVELVGRAGYDAIEPWVSEIEEYVRNGGQLADLRKRIEGCGLRVESAIGFAHWIVDNPLDRKAGLEQARRDMHLVRQIGGTRMAAPPAGATRNVRLDLFDVAERYRALLEVGAEIGVIPQLEVWGSSENLSRLGEAAFVAIESGHRDACLLPDVYHIYKGGSDFAGLRMVAGTSIHCFHVNDYPADPPRATISDRDRVYPGDGIAPLSPILQTLTATGFHGALSLELFNREYWQNDAAQVLSTGLSKMKDAVARAFS